MVEAWKNLPGFHGKYQASSLGNVRNSETLHVLKPVHNQTNGYNYVGPCVGGKNKATSVHRAVIEAFHGPCPDGMECRHLNGKRTDNRAENLAWGTRSENHADKEVHGTKLVGEMVHGSKLTAVGVRVIRRLLEFSDMSQREIGEFFGVTQGNVHCISSEKTWRHV